MCVTRRYSQFHTGFNFRVEADKWVSVNKDLTMLTRLSDELAEEILRITRHLLHDLEVGKMYHITLTSNGVFAISRKDFHGKVQFITQVDTKILLRVNAHTIERIN